MSGNRRSIRLKGFDYSTEGAYFITLVCYDRIHWFGKAVGGTIVLSDAGKIVQEEWLKSAELRKEITLDAFIIMPNHVHGIVIIGDPDLLKEGKGGTPSDGKGGAPSDGKGGWPSARTSEWLASGKGGWPSAQTPTEWRSPTKNLGSMVRGFKIGCTTRIRKEIDPSFRWIRNYYERIIRDHTALEAIRRYIKNNPK